MVVVAALEEDLVGGDLAVVRPIVGPAPRSRRRRGPEPGAAAGQESPRRQRERRDRGGEGNERARPGDRGANLVLTNIIFASMNHENPPS